MADKHKRKKAPRPETDDVMHGRSLEGASYGATERERTEDARRVPGQADDADEFVTDAEMEVREANSSPRDETRDDN